LFQGLRESWRRLKTSEPGSRFQSQYRLHQRSHRSRWSKPLSYPVGVIILGIGLVALPAPGPGTLMLALGAAIIARESAWTARSLDWLELKARALVRRLRRRSKAARADGVASPAGERRPPAAQ
jgi:uncharacterized protein (TIGR02611 family)